MFAIYHERYRRYRLNNGRVAWSCRATLGKLGNFTIQYNSRQMLLGLCCGYEDQSKTIYLSFLKFWRFTVWWKISEDEVKARDLSSTCLSHSRPNHIWSCHIWLRQRWSLERYGCYNFIASTGWHNYSLLIVHQAILTLRKMTRFIRNVVGQRRRCLAYFLYSIRFWKE
jgi:hypothetical protein